MSKPIFLLVGGIFHTPKHFGPIIDALASRGYESTVFELPQIRFYPMSLPLGEDVRQLRLLLTDLIEAQQRDVVLVAHSYGGFVGSEAIRGFERSSRLQKKLRGGLSQAFFIAAFVITQGELLGAAVGGKPPAYVQVDEFGTRAAECAKDLFFSDMDVADRQRWFDELRPMTGRSLHLKSETPCWDLDLAKVYIRTSKDEAISCAQQSSMLARVQQSQWKIVDIESGHEPFLSRTGELAAILIKHLVV